MYKRALPLPESAPAIIVVVTGNPSTVSLHHSQHWVWGLGIPRAHLRSQGQLVEPEAAGGAMGET